MFKPQTFFRRCLLYFFCALVGLYFVIGLGLFTLSKLAVMNGVEMQSTRGEFKSPHKISLLDRGVDSLHARIQLIRKAQKSIEMEFFIFDLDQTSRLLMHELITKAQQGVNVRILVDFSKPIFRLKPAYAKYLSQFGIQVRYYNTAPLYRVVSIQHRTHRKMLVVDGAEMIIGGRNIADEYFDMDPEYNFLDSDIWVEGEVVQFVQQGFDDYFESEMAHTPEVELVEEDRFLETQSFFEDREALAQTLSLVQKHSQHEWPQYPCDDVVFVTDPPSIAEEHHEIFRELARLSKGIEKEVLLESPYFILGQGGLDIFEQLANRGVKVRVLTNSLNSTDATYVTSAMASKLFEIKKYGVELHLMKGNPSASQSSISTEARWGLHAKRGVIDGKHTLVGTYNIDPRSANLNSELILICKDSAELAEATIKSMKERLLVARLMVAEGKLKDFSALSSGASFSTQVLMVLLMPLSSLFQFLL